LPLYIQPLRSSTPRHTAALYAVRALRKVGVITLVTGIILLAVGCHHNTQQAYQPPPPPPAPPPAPASSRTHRPPTTVPPITAGNHAPKPPASVPPIAPDDVSGKPTMVETGMASWYGASGHHAADGSAFDGTGMTAAHKTLPLGTTVRVTNLTTNQSVMVRITDRGPFSQGRVLDLSEGAAKQIGLYRMGVAKVRIEAFAHPSADPAGKWCVQTGAFKAEADALDLKSALLQRYRGAKVTEFPGATGFWVRIDPAQHAHSDALAILDWIGKPDPEAVPYLVRID
jgi:rare lipoprotein A